MSSDEDDDKPLGANLGHRRQEIGSDRETDRSSDSGRKRRHRTLERKSQDDGGDSGNDDGRSWKRPRDEPLFAETGKSGVDRKLERAVAEITLDMIESVRLGQARLLHILEHPRAEDFIIGAYVRYPDLEKIEADGIPPEEAPFLPAQITKIVQLETPEKVQTAMGSASCSHQMTIVQYTQRFDNSLKIRKAKLNIAHVTNDPFETRELEQWRELLKLFSGRAGAEKLQTLPQMLPETAERLKSFTFTDEDVNTILQRRMEQQEGLAKLSAGHTLNWRDLYLKKAELEFQIQELQILLAGGSELTDESLNDATERLETTQKELAQVKNNLDILRKEESNKKEPLKLEQEQFHSIPMSISRSARARPAGAADVSILTPRFLQTKSLSASSSRVMDWRSLEGTRHFTKLAWSSPNPRLDMLYKQAHNTAIEEWKELKMQISGRLRAPDVVEALATHAKEILSQNIDVERSLYEKCLGQLKPLFQLPFPCPPIKSDRTIVSVITKTEE